MISNNERGAVFIYILMAVALFAALSYAVSRGNRGGSSALTDEQAKLAAQEIIEYGNTVANAVQKLRLRGCSDTEISFENDVVSGYINPNAPSDSSCHIFNMSGGGLNFKKLNDNISNNVFEFTGNTCIQEVGTNTSCAGNDGIDSGELAILLANIERNICLEINNSLGIENPSGEPPQDNLASFQINTKFTGVYDPNGTAINAAELRSKITACYEGDTIPAAGTYHYYQVLIAR